VLLITVREQLHSRVWAQCSVVIVMTVIAPVLMHPAAGEFPNYAPDAGVRPN